MKTLHPHQLRPRIYYKIEDGWRTDRWYDQKIENKTFNL